MSITEERNAISMELPAGADGWWNEPFPGNRWAASSFPGWQAVTITEGFNFDAVKNAGWGIVTHNGKPCFDHINPHYRILYTLSEFAQKYEISARLKVDENDMEALLPIKDGPENVGPYNGLLAHYCHSRRYVFFAIEGRSRLVLYERRHNEWALLDAAEVEVRDSYITLSLDVDGAHITGRCAELGVTMSAETSHLKAGHAGIMFHGKVSLRELAVLQTDRERIEEAQRDEHHKAELLRSGLKLPAPVLFQTLEVPGLINGMVSSDFISADRYDLAVPTRTGLKAMTQKGEVLWDSPIIPQDRGIFFSKRRCQTGRLLYVIAGEWSDDSIESREICVLDGATGEIRVRKPLPELKDKEGLNYRWWYIAETTGNLGSGDDGDFVLFPESSSGGAQLWAYDKDLNLLWEQEQERPYFGHLHSIKLHDINGDGYDEVLAGGSLYSHEGELLWTHDQADNIAKDYPSEHYDAVAFGRFAGPDSPPFVFLIAGNPGLYIVDALTGKTFNHHPIGHAQRVSVGKVRDDIPGEQVLVTDRWDSFGIAALFDGYGNKLWVKCPRPYSGNGPQMVSWPNWQPKLMWHNITCEGQCFLNGEGDCIRDLPVLTALWGSHKYKEVATYSLRLGRDDFDTLVMTVKDKICLFKPESAIQNQICSPPTAR